MIELKNQIFIGIDHGYGNMKTLNFCFPTGVTAYSMLSQNADIWLMSHRL